jgi:hypothetical protein
MELNPNDKQLAAIFRYNLKFNKKAYPEEFKGIESYGEESWMRHQPTR